MPGGLGEGPKRSYLHQPPHSPLDGLTQATQRMVSSHAGGPFKKDIQQEVVKRDWPHLTTGLSSSMRCYCWQEVRGSDKCSGWSQGPEDQECPQPREGVGDGCRSSVQVGPAPSAPLSSPGLRGLDEAPAPVRTVLFTQPMARHACPGERPTETGLASASCGTGGSYSSVRTTGLCCKASRAVACIL